MIHSLFLIYGSKREDRRPASGRQSFLMICAFPGAVVSFYLTSQLFSSSRQKTRVNKATVSAIPMTMK